MHVAVVNTKGGVGKTTTAVHLAALLAEGNARSLLVDADPYGSASAWLDDAGMESVDHVTYTQPGMAAAVGRVSTDYDHVVIDTPPNDVAMTQEAVIAADLVVVPTGATLGDLDRLSTVRDVVASISTLKEVPMTVLLTRVDSRARDAADAREALERLGYEVAEIEIPTRVAVARSFGQAIDLAQSPYRDLATALCVAAN